jgi:hypothetical protein
MASSENEDFIDDDPKRTHDSGTLDLEGKQKQMLQQQAEPAAVTKIIAKPRGGPTSIAKEYGPDVTGNDISNSNQQLPPNHTCYEVDADVKSTAAGKASSSSISSSTLPRVLENLEHIKTW